MRIGVLGAGVSGLVCAYLLSREHEVVLLEREDRLGGHAHTHDVEHEGRRLPVDTGFIVFNERNYPGFCRLLARLGVPARSTTMSFSVRDDADGFEYGGQSLAGAVGPVRNLVRARWWKVAGGVVRLGSRGKRMLREAAPDATIADLAAGGAFSREFLDGYLLPMAGAIWSAPRDALLRFPARFFLRFFDNHGMLDLRERPQWRTVEGGSRVYVDAIGRALGGAARTGCVVEGVRRGDDSVRVRVRSRGVREEAVFDEVVVALHSDVALSVLEDASVAERAVLGAMPYQANDAVLHRDGRMLPRLARCRAAWNVRVREGASRPVSVTYDLSRLQGLGTRVPLCETLNDGAAVDGGAVLARMVYEHPLYTVEGERARARWGEISGVRRTHYCGAYWGNGFHEDGVASALRVCARFGASL